MTVYDLLVEVIQDERRGSLTTSLESVGHRFPDVYTRSTYSGRPGAELDTVEQELKYIHDIDQELTCIDAELHALEAAAAEERDRARGRWVLGGLLVAIVVLIFIVQGML